MEIATVSLLENIFHVLLSYICIKVSHWSETAAGNIFVNNEDGIDKYDTLNSFTNISINCVEFGLICPGWVVLPHDVHTLWCSGFVVMRRTFKPGACVCASCFHCAVR